MSVRVQGYFFVDKSTDLYILGYVAKQEDPLMTNVVKLPFGNEGRVFRLTAWAQVDNILQAAGHAKANYGEMRRNYGHGHTPLHTAMLIERERDS